MWRVVWFMAVLMLTACATKSPPVVIPPPPQITGTVPSGKPFLRLETGGHTAQLNRIAVDAAGQYLVTGSHDKTARVWRVANGALLQTLRPSIGEGDEGKVYAVAISPDGGVVAVGGFTGKKGEPLSIYLFDRATGQMLRHIGGLPNSIDDLSFSKDGRYLAAGLENGIRVYRTDDWQEVARDADNIDTSYSVDFDGTGRLLTTSYDGFIRLYDTHFNRLAKQKALGGDQPYQARFSPDGTKIAVGFYDSTTVNVLSGKDLSFMYTPDTRLANHGDLGTVAWSSDGDRLYAGGRFEDDLGWHPVFCWVDAGRGPVKSFRVSTNTVMDLRPLPDSRLVFGASDPAVGVLNRDGNKQWEHPPDNTLDLRASSIDKLRVFQDGSQVEFGFNTYLPDGGSLQHQVFFDLAHPSPQFDTSSTSGLVAADTEGEAIANWFDTDHPQIHGQSLTLRHHESSYSLALSWQSVGFLLGTEWNLRYYESPDTIRWALPIPGFAWAVNLSPDGRYALAAFGDGTVRWYKTANGQEVLALYIHPDRKRWIVWTPEGFYDAAPGAESLIGYHINQGPDREAKFVSAAQMEQRYYRPDLIARRLSADGDRLIAEAVNSLGDVAKTLADGLPPELELVSSRLDGFDLLLEFRIKPHNGGVGRIVYTVNGVEQEPRGGLAVAPPGSTLPLRVSLPAGQTNTVALAAFNARNSIASLPLTVPPQTTPEATVKPTLYVLAVGVSHYKDPSLSLKYAAADAQAISDLLVQQGQPLFQVAPPKLLMDADASLDHIKAAFKELSGHVKENDVFLLYLAGHGAVFDGAYHFIPPEAIYTNEQDFRAASLNTQGFQDLLKTIRAQKSLILLDTCHAGAMKLASLASGLAMRGDLDEKTAITKLQRATGRTVLMASSDKAMALEGYQQHGFFTAALLQGLNGEADTDKDHRVDGLELAIFVEKRVPIISKDRQFPIHESNGNNFPIRYLQ